MKTTFAVLALLAMPCHGPAVSDPGFGGVEPLQAVACSAGPQWESWSGALPTTAPAQFPAGQINGACRLVWALHVDTTCECPGCASAWNYYQTANARADGAWHWDELVRVPGLNGMFLQECGR